MEERTPLTPREIYDEIVRDAHDGHVLGPWSLRLRDSSLQREFRVW